MDSRLPDLGGLRASPAPGGSRCPSARGDLLNEPVHQANICLAGRAIARHAAVCRRIGRTRPDAYTMVRMMQGVIEFGTGRRINNYFIPTQKAGKTGTTNGNTDGWFIGYTPELLAGSWVGCEDPFIPIYTSNSGGGEMAGPKWGLFMNRVYSDSKLNYGKITEFEQPLEFRNNPIYADMNFANIANSGDSLDVNVDDQQADDFIDESELLPIDDKKNKKGLDTSVKSKKDSKEKKTKKSNDY